MARRLVGITADNLSDLPDSCRGCAFWELSPSACGGALRAGTAAEDKLSWVSGTVLEWGSCGQLLYVDEQLAGYITYAPSAYVPRSGSFATSPVSADALLLMTARVLPEHAGQGLGRVLVQTAAREAARRGVRALEAFGRTGLTHAAPVPEISGGCMLPVEYLLAVGLKPVRGHAATPRLRLDIRTTATWRADMESALERLLGTIQSPALSR